MGLFRDPPIAIEFELERTAFITFDGAGAESTLGRLWKRERDPSRDGRRGGGCEVEIFRGSKKIDLDGLRLAWAKPRSERFGGKEIAEVAGRSGVFFASAGTAVEGERVLSARHGDVEQAAFLFAIEFLAVARSNGLRIAQFLRELDEGFPIRCGK